jgi:hypothetical protein
VSQDLASKLLELGVKLNHKMSFYLIFQNEIEKKISGLYGRRYII